MDEILARLQRRSSAAATPAATPGAAARPPQPRPEPTPPPATYGYAPIYYPGTPDPDQATTIALEDGEERAGIDISLQLVRTMAIGGHVSIGTGALPSNTQVTVARQGLKGLEHVDLAGQHAAPRRRGEFQVHGALAGQVPGHGSCDIDDTGRDDDAVGRGRNVVEHAADVHADWCVLGARGSRPQRRRCVGSHVEPAAGLADVRSNRVRRRHRRHAERVDGNRLETRRGHRRDECARKRLGPCRRHVRDSQHHARDVHGVVCRGSLHAGRCGRSSSTAATSWTSRSRSARLAT